MFSSLHFVANCYSRVQKSRVSLISSHEQHVPYYSDLLFHSSDQKFSFPVRSTILESRFKLGLFVGLYRQTSKATIKNCVFCVPFFSLLPSVYGVV